MSKIKNLPKTLPEHNPYFDLDSEGEITKHKYSGHFETQIPNLRIQSKIKKYVAFLNGGFDSTLDSQIINLHTMTAYCRLCLTECPDWFKDCDYGLDLYDYNVLEEIYGKILEKEKEWLDSVHGKDEKEEESEREK